MIRLHRLWALLFFLLPVNVYSIGGGLGAGVQFPLFRVQETVLGTSTITIVQDVLYVVNGIVAGRTAVSVMLWMGALVFYAAATVLLFRRCPACLLRFTWCRPGRVLAAGTLLLLGSTMMQYGPTFASAGGYAVPVGLPLLFYLALLFASEGEQDCKIAHHAV
ncbi:MAG: hypothetical protein GKC04_00165 [Methanomicrobiales archaeon]|nr:hypothetical protein [Methanomicrobiales archaeon]